MRKVPISVLEIDKDTNGNLLILVPLILCGDWNLVLNFKLDTFGYIRENNVKAREKVKEFMDSFNLIDGWRSNDESSE